MKKIKKIVYLAPLALLGISVKASANQVPTHISNALMVYEQESNQTQTASQPIEKTETEQPEQNVPASANGQNQPVEKTKKTTHISRLDSGLINKDSSVGNEQASQVMKIVNGADAIPIEQESSEASVAGMTNSNSDQHTIKNPNNGQVIVHYVDENGKAIAGLNDYTIDINSAPEGNSTGQFKVPDTRYSLPDPTSNYQLQRDKHTIHHDAVTHTVHHDAITHTVHHDAEGHNEVTKKLDGFDWYNNPGTNLYDQHVGEANGWVPSIVNSQSQPNHITTYYTPHYDTITNWVEDNSAYDENVVDTPAYDENVVDKPAYDETVGDNVFSDNSKNIKSIIGNTVNVILDHGTTNVDAGNSDVEVVSWRKVHVINSNNQSNLINESVNFKVGYTLDLVSLAKVTNPASYEAASDPNSFIGENHLTDPVGFSTINNKLLSISL